MAPSIPVELLLQRVPVRSREVYTALITDPESAYDSLTGWSSAFVSQARLAASLDCSKRTVERAVSDLKTVGVVRVLAWPGARTETQVRILDVEVTSIFGPVRLAQSKMRPCELVDVAIRVLNSEWSRLRREAEMT